MRDLEATALAFDRATRAAGVSYALIGGFAVSAWGQPRTTSDIDALVDLPEGSIERFLASLQAEGLTTSKEDLHDVLRDGGHVTLFDAGSSFHVDAKLCRSASEREEVARATEVPFLGASLRFVRPEEAIVHKLRFGSEQDLADALSILARQQGRLDEPRLDHLARSLGVAPALQRLRENVARAEKER